MTNIVKQEWSLKRGLKPGSHNIHSHPLVEPNKILLSLLHVKLEELKNFVKAMDKEGSGLAFLQKFPWISMEKLNAGIFDGPQIRELIKDPIFDGPQIRELIKDPIFDGPQLRELIKDQIFDKTPSEAELSA